MTLFRRDWSHVLAGLNMTPGCAEIYFDIRWQAEVSQLSARIVKATLRSSNSLPAEFGGQRVGETKLRQSQLADAGEREENL